MRILLLTHTFNSLSQRIFIELSNLGNDLSVEFDINDAVTTEAVELFRPQLILAPYLRRAIPESIWRNHVTLVVHPGIVGDRGPSAIDWAILDGEADWGVTVLQAEAEMDAGPIWATESFAMRETTKSSLYRNEVTEAALRAVLGAVERVTEYNSGTWKPIPLDKWTHRGSLRPAMKPEDRAIDWERDNTSTVLRKIRASDSFPGVPDSLFGKPCNLFDARSFPATGTPGELLGRVGDGVVKLTLDGAVWIGHAKRPDFWPGIKLPTVVAFPEATELNELSEETGDIRYEEVDSVGYLHFDFYNGAMGTRACKRLLSAYNQALSRPTRVIVLMGGDDFFSNGLDLNLIEASESPSDESLLNIEAMDDLCQAILETDDRLTISALKGNAGAGGAFLALAADEVWARSGVILNPHYKNMGNLYGSEFWTYRLPLRVGEDSAIQIMQNRLPIGVEEAKRLGFIDDFFGQYTAEFVAQIKERASVLAGSPDLTDRLAAKRSSRATDEAAKSLLQYRAEELSHMQRNFYGFDPSYHVARHHFVQKTPHSWTPRHLARHRELGWTLPED